MVLGDAESDLVPLAAIFFIFGLPVLGWLGIRWLAHRERMEMIRHGIDPGAFRKGYRAWQQPQPAPDPVPGPPYPTQAMGYGYGYPNEAAQIALRKALFVVAVGFALTLGLSFIGWDGGRLTPGPWLLGGLIPLFVGLAQVFGAMMAGATFRPYGAAQQQYRQQPGAMPPPGPTPPQGAQAPPPAGSYTYRPGATPELRPPAPPAQRDN